MPEDRFPQAGRRWHQGWEEVLVAAVLLVGAIFFRLRIEDFVRGREGSFLGPEFWPATLLTIAIVLSAVYLVLAVIWARRQSAEASGGHGATAPATVEQQAAAEPAARAEPSVTTAEPSAASTGGDTAVSAEPDAEPHAGAAAATPPAEVANTGGVGKLLGGIAVLAAFIYLLGPIGFVPAGFLFSVAFMLLVGERRWWVLLLFPVVALTVLLGIFTQLLVVSLPRGTGIFIDLSTYFY